MLEEFTTDEIRGIDDLNIRNANRVLICIESDPTYETAKLFHELTGMSYREAEVRSGETADPDSTLAGFKIRCTVNRTTKTFEETVISPVMMLEDSLTEIYQIPCSIPVDELIKVIEREEDSYYPKNYAINLLQNIRNK